MECIIRKFYAITIPIFDENDIWEYQQARFSNQGNVEETICHIVDQSLAGISAGEIAEILQILDLSPFLHFGHFRDI